MEENEENKDLENEENTEDQSAETSQSSHPAQPSQTSERVQADEADEADEEVEKITIKQVSVKWGVIAGIVGILVYLILAMTGTIYNSKVSWIGIIPFIVILVLAHREFKNEGDGYMSYGQGLSIALLLSLVSSVISSLFTYVYIKFIDTAYYENMNAALMEQWEKQGMTQEQMDTAMGLTSRMQNPELGIIFGILGGVFFGFLVALIVSAITKNTNPEAEI